jgi:hypothetical protein
VITKVIAVELDKLVAKVFISYSNLRHAASKVILKASSGSPLT